MPITCCRYCVPPKRHTACWDTCPDYLEEKARDAESKLPYTQRHAVDKSISAQRGRTVNQALKRRRHK